jgi:UDP-N-acetylglucosamine 2-epimerase (non-hydrolysing)
MKKILIIFGTRPEAIKMAPVITEFKKKSKFKTIVCVTGQHKEMLRQVLSVFNIEPDIDLALMTQNQTLGGLTSLLIKKVEEVISDVKPDLVLVHGDTATTFASSIASFYCKIPVGHVEAGLRTGDLNAPWPEEMNRTFVGKVASLNFCPTETSKNNLLKEGADIASIFITGNTVIDSLLFGVNQVNESKNLQDKFLQEMPFLKFNKNVICVTGHRRENFGQGFSKICDALHDISKITNVLVVYPVHMNPNVKDIVNKRLGHIENILLIEPMEYLPFIYLMSKSKIILTDSGGIQEEAPSLQKPVLVMRDVTERPEALEAGTIKLVGTNTNLIVNEVRQLLSDSDYYDSMIKEKNPYGDGKAAERIVGIVENYFSLVKKS